MKNTIYLVEKHRTSWLLLFALLLCGSLNAKVDHYMGLYVDAGEWSLMPAQSKYSMSYGAGGDLGFLYELQAGAKYKPARFLFDVGLGVKGGWTSYMQSSDMEIPLPGQKDLDEDTFDYIYEVKDRHDSYADVTVHVPVLLGFQYKRFYMLAGVKLTPHFLTFMQIDAKVKTYGRYEQFAIHSNMPEYQFFDNIPLKGSSRATLNFHADASLEIGGRLGTITDETGFDVPPRNIECRLAGFVDYGFMDMHYSPAQPLEGLTAPSSYNAEEAYKTTTMIDKLTVNDIMSTKDFASKVTNLMVGIKFTILFRLPEPGQCVICQDAYLPTYKLRRGGVKHEE